MTKIYLDFTVRSNLMNISLSDILFLKSSGHKIGEFSKTGIRLDYSEWSCDTETYITDDVNTVLEEFSKLIKPHLAEIKKRIKEYQVEVLLCFVIKKEMTDSISFFLDSKMIHFCSEINASVDFD